MKKLLFIISISITGKNFSMEANKSLDQIPFAIVNSEKKLKKLLSKLPLSDNKRFLDKKLFPQGEVLEDRDEIPYPLGKWEVTRLAAMIKQQFNITFRDHFSDSCTDSDFQITQECKKEARLFLDQIFDDRAEKILFENVKNWFRLINNATIDHACLRYHYIHQHEERWDYVLKSFSGMYLRLTGDVLTVSTIKINIPEEEEENMMPHQNSGNDLPLMMKSSSI